MFVSECNNLRAHACWCDVPLDRRSSMQLLQEYWELQDNSPAAESVTISTH